MDLTNEQKVLQQVINEAWENETFKQELIAEPLKAIEKLTGDKLQLPEGKTLVVRDQSNGENIYINIPSKPSLEDVELNEDQLEAIAGGGFWDVVWEIAKSPITVNNEGFEGYADALINAAEK